MYYIGSCLKEMNSIIRNHSYDCRYPGLDRNQATFVARSVTDPASFLGKSHYYYNVKLCAYAVFTVTCMSDYRWGLDW
jgi:hypothetical protein